MAKENKDEEVYKQKEILFRGKNIEELKKLDVRESAKFMPSRSRRSVLRKFDVIEKFVRRCEDAVARKKKIRTHLRDIVIVPKLVGMQIGVHSGKTFNDVQIVQEMIGHRLGEFSLTRQKVSHGTAGIGATKGSKALKK
ncbi:MAG: ribosomal protein S19 family protein [archaeon]|nr:ribosomal protein S19 family protein [archaeon]